MKCAMICSENQVTTELLNGLAYSSQHADFPAANVQDGFPAYKTWRSGGYFVVGASNDTLIFRDDTTTDLEATIAHGTYTSVAAFLAAVEDALNDAGVAEYTVAQNPTSFKYEFTSDKSGGATAFQIRADDADCTARTILGLGTTAYTASSFDDVTHTADLVCLHTEEWLEFDFGTPVQLQAAILLGRTREVWSLSESAVITLQINETTAWDSPEFETTLSRTDFGAFTVNSEGLFEARRRARIKISDPTNPNGYAEIAKIFLGEMLQFQRGSALKPFDDDIEDLTVTIDSIGGVTSADPYPTRSVISYQMDYLTNLDKELLQDVYLKYGKKRPLFFIFDHNDALGTVPERLVKFMRFADKPKFIKLSAVQWTCSLTLKEEL